MRNWQVSDQVALDTDSACEILLLLLGVCQPDKRGDWIVLRAPLGQPDLNLIVLP